MAAFTVIEHQELGAAAASVTFSSIPSSYDHLYLVISARSDGSGTSGYIRTQLNSDTGSNYSYTYLTASTATPSSARGASQTYLGHWPICAGGHLADTFGTVKAWIPNYANTSNYKQVLAKSAQENNSTSDWYWTVRLDADLWRSTAAIDTIYMVENDGDDFVQYSTFTLYGVKGA